MTLARLRQVVYTTRTGAATPPPGQAIFGGTVIREDPMHRVTRTALSFIAVAASMVALNIGGPPPASASDNGQSITPAMGWSSWSFIRRNPTAAKIIAQANALKSSGLTDRGYVYVNLDDFFQKCDSNGFVVDGNGR